MTIDLDALVQTMRITAGYTAPVLLMPHEALALVAEVERLHALEADAERARVKADLWNYYEALVSANGAEGITQLVVQRDDARAEVERLRAFQNNALHAGTDEVAEERAAVVAYLRELGAINSMLSPMKGAADDIENGEHRREETK